VDFVVAETTLNPIASLKRGLVFLANFLVTQGWQAQIWDHQSVHRRQGGEL